MGIPTQQNRSNKATAADFVMTPKWLSKAIINHYKPVGYCLDPCKGDGSFYEQMPSPKDWCEIEKGRDFFDYSGNKVDWIITNPPFSIYNAFLKKCFEVSDNVVLLVPIAKAFKSLSTERIVQEYGGLKEIWLIGSGTTCGFAFGFPTGCLYYRRFYNGPIKYIFQEAHGELSI